MSKTKRFIAVMAALLCGGAMVFAGGAKDAGGGKKVLKLAATLPADASPIQCLTAAADQLRKDTNGALDIQIFPASQLGGQREFTEGVSMGTIEMCIIANGALESFEPRWAVYSIPFLFNNADHVYKFYDSPLNQQILADFRNKSGIYTLGMFTEGEFRTVWTRTKPVRRLEDFRGVKLRVPEIPIYIDLFNALGANATPMPFGDVYTGLQTGIIDGLELAATSVILNNLTEVNKYNTKTMHIASPMVVLVNDGVYKSLSPEHQKALSNAIAAASKQDRINAETNSKNNDNVLKQRGLEIIDLPASEITKIRQAVQPVIDNYTKSVFAPAFLDQVRALGN
jgi:C4-dicarboxylate-binding protein DctP